MCNFSCCYLLLRTVSDSGTLPGPITLMTQFLQMSIMDFERLSLKMKLCVQSATDFLHCLVAQLDHSLTPIGGWTDDPAVNYTQGRAQTPQSAVCLIIPAHSARVPALLGQPPSFWGIV